MSADLRSAVRADTKLPTRRAAFGETLVGHVTGLALTLGGAGMGVSALVDFIEGGHAVRTLIACGLLTGVPGLVLWLGTRPPPRMVAASIYSAVLASWVAICLASTLPYLLSGTLDRFDLALFESVSGFTTTNATVLRTIEGASRGILFWRATTQWLGGIGFVVFAVSVLPVLGAGGMELVEAPGAGSDRLAPRVRAATRRLVLIYVVFTAVVGGAYAAFGMSAFDAVAHALTTVSTGGFSTHDGSFGFFVSPALQWVAIAAMVVAGGSFTLYWRALRGKPVAIFRSGELRVYLAVMTLIAAAAVGWTSVTDGFDLDLMRRTIFSTVSVSTTTGYTVLDFTVWPGAVQLLLLFTMGLGGMSASTTGGLKIFRLLAVLSYSRRQLFRQLHRRAVDVVRFGREIVPEAVVARAVGFFGLFMAIGALATFLVAAFGADMTTAISSVASAIGNVGPALGEAEGPGGLGRLSAGGRWVVVWVMLIGRLEVFPVLLGAVPLLRFVVDRLPARASQVFLRLFRG